MKILMTPPKTRSLFALGLGCTLAVLPLRLVSAQDNVEKPPTAATTPMPASPGERTTGITKASDQNPVDPKHTAKSTLTLKEKQFMRKAVGGNEAEVQLANLALKKSESPEVKEFAQKMIDEHGKWNKDVEQIAQDEGLLNFRVETTPEQKSTFGRMETYTGKAFDAAYAKHAAADHETDLKDYQKASKEAKLPALKAYVDKTIPMIEEHLKMAKALDQTKKGGNS